jgi:hypothetical protein
MMINIDYASIVASAKSSGTTSVNFDNTVQPVKAITAQQDTVTLSKQALALMNGNSIKSEEDTPTYIRPETARSLLAQNETESDPADIEKQEKSQMFADVMQNILDQRTGIDRKKLEEINAMIEEIAANEDMSPEEKEQAIEMLEKVKEELIEESMELQKIVKQTDITNEEV